jgi:hypothetical protein
LDSEIQAAWAPQIEHFLNQSITLENLGVLDIPEVEENDFLQIAKRSLAYYSPIQDVSFTKTDNQYNKQRQQIKTSYYLEFLVDGNWQRWETLSDGTAWRPKPILTRKSENAKLSSQSAIG